MTSRPSCVVQCLVGAEPRENIASWTLVMSCPMQWRDAPVPRWRLKTEPNNPVSAFRRQSKMNPHEIRTGAQHGTGAVCKERCPRDPAATGCAGLCRSVCGCRSDVLKVAWGPLARARWLPGKILLLDTITHSYDGNWGKATGHSRHRCRPSLETGHPVRTWRCTVRPYNAGTCRSGVAANLPVVVSSHLHGNGS